MQHTPHTGEAETFDIAPVALWLEDYSRLKAHFDSLRAQGVTSLREFLESDFARVQACSSCIRILKVNHRTLSLFEAENFPQLTEKIDHIFRDDMLTTHIEELVQLWEGRKEFSSNAVNYTLGGKRLDIQLKARILPGYENTWERVLVVTEDVTEREEARRRLAESDAYARGLFEHSPVSLWVEDFSAIKSLLDEVRGRGIVDFRVFTDVHPEFVQRCMNEIRVIDVNQYTLDIFGAPNRKMLLHRLPDVFRDDMHNHFREQLIDLWQGKLFQSREVVNYALDGTELHFHLQFSVLPGHEDNWSLVQVALTDITARKKAEAYLEYLGRHDVLTKLHNRSFFVEEMNRLERKGPQPVTILMADLNGLKETNDLWGHDAGDSLLRRAGEVLSKHFEKPSHAWRIGGDEFAVLMPATDFASAGTVIETVEKLIELNNQFHASSGLTLSLSMGMSTSRPGERLEATAKRADLMMLDAKRRHYAAAERDRRRMQPVAS
jgi:diguanylate cyclase (GGDEF)-like protein